MDSVPLPHPSSLSPSPHPLPTTSILFEPSSLSLALTHSDSSLSLYPSFSPFSPSQTLTLTLTIPSPSSSSTFLLLQNHTNPTSSVGPTVLFIVSSPHRAGILLRLYRLRRLETPSFSRVTDVLCSHKDLRFEPNLGVVLNAKHGASVRLAGSVNYFALHALSSNKVWVFAVKDDDDGGLRLMRCAVIECTRPVFSVNVAFGFLILGEENGVRVFGLRRLVKGRSGKRVGNSKQLRNGGGGRGAGLEAVNCNGDLKGKMERYVVATAVKQTNVKLKHDNRDGGVDITGNVLQLPHIMKVRSLAVLPDLSTMSQTIWISDGCHSVHMFTAMDIENALNEADGNDCNEKLMHLPVIRVLFSSEKIQDIISLSANSILILGQDCKYHWTGNIRGVLYFWTFDFQQLKATCPAKPVTVNCWTTYLQQRCWLFIQLALCSFLDVGLNHGFLSENSARFDIKGMILAIGLASFVGIVLLDCNFLISAMPMVAIVVKWAVKARISREKSKSRRYSASYIRSFREDTRSFRSNITISSTASSPGYPLKALQARSAYRSWECLSPEGFALNSKWNEAEKYICNPFSGEVPMECLSAKTLSGRSFRNSTTNRITMSAPLVYSSRHMQTKASSTCNSCTQEEVALQFHIPEKGKEGMTRDAGTQSTPPLVSSNPKSDLTPSIIKRPIKLSEDSLNSNAKTITEEEVKVKDKESWDTTKEITVREVNVNENMKKDEEQVCTQGSGGCFSWIRKKISQREKERQQRRDNMFFTHFKVC
ncbi:hypothetical protein HKD37_13G035799 [Glycine soja]